jgi:flagellar basal body L-ring protein FlgH
MKKYILAVIMLASLIAVLDAKTIWKDRNPYAAEGDVKVGTVIVVSINDISDMKFSVSVSDKSNAAVSSNPDTTITGFLPRVAAQKKISSDENTQFNGKGKLAISIATRVLNRAGAMLSVAGSRTYTFNGATTIITVTGLVDPALLKGRAIDSNSVADFTLEIRGLKRGINIQRPPLKKDEKADSTLTEDEKQKIIVDYLQRMLGELTR